MATNSTAVARREDVRELQRQVPAGTVHPAVQAEIEARKVRNAIVQQIRGTVWAKDYSEGTIRAIAEYGARHGIDPVTEMEILGGRIYLTASYFQRRGAELIAAGVVDAIEQDHVAHDPRLDTLAQSDVADEAEWARREIARRLRVRIQHGAPEKAAAICVTRIRVRGLTEAIEGCNWCGGGVRQRDPVGDAEPTKTAETRSARRAWKQLVNAVPALAAREAQIGEEGTAVEAVATVDREAQARLSAAEPARSRALAAGAGSYGDDEPPVGVVQAVDDDVYGTDAHGGELALDDARPRRTSALED